MGILLSDAAATAESTATSYGLVSTIALIVLFLVMTWLMSGPQRKEQKRLTAMLSELQIGDNIMTSSGFYGMVIDINDDTVIIEFGNNKNCRIPMKKEFIVQVEKPGAE